VRSMPRCYKQKKSRVLLVVRKSPASKEDVNTEAEETTVLEAVTRRQPLKIQHTEKTFHVLQ
jgi:hypothetical protein